VLNPGLPDSRFPAEGSGRAQSTVKVTKNEVPDIPKEFGA